MGELDADGRTFKHGNNKGRLSIICERRIHFHGVELYAVQFVDGELCSADGVGYVISCDLPCTKNIQKIFSVFANRTGRICIRMHEEVERCSQHVRQLEVGDWLEVIADLWSQIVSFAVWPKDGSEPSYAAVSFQGLRPSQGRKPRGSRRPKAEGRRLSPPFGCFSQASRSSWKGRQGPPKAPNASRLAIGLHCRIQGSVLPLAPRVSGASGRLPGPSACR